MENSEHQSGLSPQQRILNIIGHVPYGFGSFVLRVFGAIPLVRKLVLGHRLKILNLALPRVKQGFDKGHEAAIFFAANFLMPWRANALSRSTLKVFSKRVCIEGEEHFLGAMEKGHGVVILNSHTGASRLVPLIMMRRGHVVNAMEPEPWLRRMGAKGAERINVIELRSGDNFWLKELFQAKSVLDRNEILHLAVDGLQGRKGMDYPFLGKARTFYSSFAELAVRTGAAAVPVFATIDARGYITVSFMPALNMGDPSQEDAERVKSIVSQYINLLEEKWRTELGNMVAKHIYHYLQLEDVPDNEDGKMAPATAVSM